MQKDNTFPQPEELASNCPLKHQENFSVAFLLQIIDGTEDPIFVKDRQHRWVLLNDAFCDFLGHQREELIGKSDYNFFSKAEADVLWEKDELIFVTGVTNENEEFFTNAFGVTRVISTKKSLFEDEVGNKFLVATIRDITQYKQAEVELRQSKQLLQLVIDNIPELIFWKDRNSVYLGCNQKFANVVGTDSPENIVGLNDYDLPWKKEESDWYRECDRRVMESAVPELHIIETQQQADGKQSWLDTDKIPLRDAQGNVVGILVTYKDITERKLAEEALRQSQAKLQKLSANVPGMLYQFMLHPDGSVSFPYISSGSYELYGLTPEEIQADASLIISIIHPDQRHDFEQSVAVSAQTLQPWRWEGQFVLPTGEAKWIQAASRPELQADGSILWDGILMDVTRSKQAEEALQQAYVELERRVQERTKELVQSNEALQIEIAERQQAQAELWASEQKLALLIEQTPVAVIEWNTKFEVQAWNLAAEKIFGYSRSEAVGSYFEFLVPEIAREHIKQITVALLRQQGGTLSVNENLTKDNKIIICEWYNSLLVDDNGEAIAIASMVLDITERKQAETQLQQQTQDLEIALQELQQTQMQLVQSEKMSGLGQLVAGVAHEINNPVNFIYGNLTHANDYIQDLVGLVQLYQQYYPHPVTQVQELAAEIDLEFLMEDLLKLLNSMKVGAQRIREIVLSLRTFSRMDEADMKEVNIHEGIDSTLMILEHRIKATPERCAIEVIKEYGNPPLVECYPGQLNQVFMNILANAIDALEESTLKNSGLLTKPQIRISTGITNEQQVVIRIVDNGLGMPKEVQQRLFDPFFSTKPIGKGTGMGLSISYQIISQKHGGTLECVSQPGGGAEFVVVIPLHQG